MAITLRPAGFLMPRKIRRFDVTVVSLQTREGVESSNQPIFRRSFAVSAFFSELRVPKS